MRNGEGFLLVYSITSQSSFEEIEQFHQQICRVKDKDYFPMVLVANKCDLESERQVPSEEGRELASRYGCQFIETSAKEYILVDEVFHETVRDIRRYNKEQENNRHTIPPTSSSKMHAIDSHDNNATSKCCVLM